MSLYTRTSPSNEPRLTETPEQSGSQSVLPIHTYLVAARGLVKIGRSRHPLTRMTLIARWQAGEKRPVSLAATTVTVLLVLPADCEKELHQRFAHDRCTGEWFHHTEAIHQYVTDNHHRNVWTGPKEIKP